MKNTLFVVSPHSFVDLITNSSSEVFVCREDKTVEIVEAVLRKLLATHNELGSYSVAFEEAFGKIEVAPYSFRYWDFSRDLRGRYEEFHYCISTVYPQTDYMDTPRYRELQRKQDEMGKELNVHEEGLYDTDREEYDRRLELYHEKREEIWKDWNVDAQKAKLALFDVFCEQNGLPIVSPPSNTKLNLWNVWGENPPAGWEFFEFCLGWGVEAKKGALMVHSKSDNTIPFEIFDAIEQYLGASRYHLG